MRIFTSNGYTTFLTENESFAKIPQRIYLVMFWVWKEQNFMYISDTTTLQIILVIILYAF